MPRTAPPSRLPHSPSDLDGVFEEVATTRDTYAACAPLVSTVAEGINATVFAYGQTGSGKSHTMFGSTTEDGLITLAARGLLAAAASQGAALSVSCLQIYQGKILTDLVEPAAGSITAAAGTARLRVREGADGDVAVPGLSRHAVTSTDQVASTGHHHPPPHHATFTATPYTVMTDHCRALPTTADHR